MSGDPVLSDILIEDQDCYQYFIHESPKTWIKKAPGKEETSYYPDDVIDDIQAIRKLVFYQNKPADVQMVFQLLMYAGMLRSCGYSLHDMADVGTLRSAIRSEHSRTRSYINQRTKKKHTTKPPFLADLYMCVRAALEKPGFAYSQDYQFSAGPSKDRDFNVSIYLPEFTGEVIDKNTSEVTYKLKG